MRVVGSGSRLLPPISNVKYSVLLVLCHLPIIALLLFRSWKMLFQLNSCYFKNNEVKLYK